METQYGDPNKSDSRHLLESNQLFVRKLTTVVVGDTRRADSKLCVLQCVTLPSKAASSEK